MADWTEPLYTAEEMRAAEAGHDVEAMMERAGGAVAESVLRRYPDARRISCVCGGGANGGDGRIAARLMCEAGRDASEGLDAEADLVVDALFGTGFHGEPRLDAAELIERINTASAPVVAVDLPSGVDASTGEVAGAAVRADVTVTMHGSKVGLAVAPGTFYAGEIEIADIGLEDGETAHRLVTSAVLAGVPPRKRRDNKYTAGSVLVVGGSPGYTGALCLAAEAAFRADAGYVAVAAPRESLAIVEQRLLEVVKTELDDVDEAAERASAVAIGPGLGRGDDEKALVRRLLEQLDTPIVLDADALHELEPFQREAATVLTPHDGELARLIGEESTWVAAHRLEALHRGVERFACVVLLKGADTLIGAPGEPVLVHSSDTPGLATAGSGDVLTGIVAAFLAKGVDHRVAPAAAVAAQTEAARRLPQRGLIASDVIDQLPHVFPSCTALS